MLIKKLLKKSIDIEPLYSHTLNVLDQSITKEIRIFFFQNIMTLFKTRMSE